MGSNGGLGTTSRTSSSLSSPMATSHHGGSQHVLSNQHIINKTVNNDNLSDNNPGSCHLLEGPLTNSAASLGLEIETKNDDSPSIGQGQNGGQNGGQSADEDAANYALTLTKQDFLVSFMVDARGGSMKGCRYSGVKVSF